MYKKVADISILLLLLHAVGTAEWTFPRDYIVDIVPSIRRIFNSACVFLIHTDQHTEIWLQKLQKELAQKDVSTALVYYRKLNLTDNPYYCKRTLPLYVVLSAEDEIKNFLIQLSTTASLSLATWLLFHPQESFDMEEEFRDVNVPFDCEFLVAHPKANTVYFTEVYRIDKPLPLRTYSFGNLSSTRELQWVNNDLYARRDSLYGHVVRIAYNYGEFNNSEEMAAAALKSEQGTQLYPAVVWMTLEQLMNFRTEFYSPADKSFGAVSPNGTWNGMMGMLLRREVDVGVDMFIMTSSRRAYTDFMTPLMPTKSRLFIKKPDSLEHKWTDFLAPLSTRLWLTVISSVIVLAAFLSATDGLGRRFGVDTDGAPKYMFLESLYCIFGSFCQQGHSVTPSSLACRTVYLTSYMVGVILVAAYSASLISYLTVQRIKLPFTTFHSLLEIGNYRFGVIDRSAQLNYFDNSTNPTLQKVYQQLLLPEKDVLPKSEGEGLLRICSEHRYSFMTPFDTPLSSDVLPCVMLEIPRASIPGSFAFPITKRYRFQGLFNRYLEAMRRTGVLRRLRLMAWPRKPSDLRSPWDSVTMEEVLPLFQMLLGGTVIAVLVLIGEVTMRRSEQGTPEGILTSSNGFRTYKKSLC